jgi:DNA-binding transcriptional regulator YdaS (Cro superfamily)
MARALGVTPAAVNQWCKGLRAVPAERCPEVERETLRVAADKGDPGLVVTCESLRPDVEWSVLRRRDPQPSAPAPEEQSGQGGAQLATEAGRGG